MAHIYAISKTRREDVMILKRIEELANKEGITIAALEKKLGFGNGTIRGWKDSSPTVEKLKKVADYFKMPMEYFLEEKEQKEVK